MAALELFGALALIVLSYLVVGSMTYGLNGIPGPLIARFSNIWRLASKWRGDYLSTIRNLHNDHGSVIRIGPNVVSIADPLAMDSIFGVKADLRKVRYLIPLQLSRL